MMKPIALTLLLGASVLAGCNDSDRVQYDGQYFRAKVAKVDKRVDVFTVTIKDPTRSIEGARAAAHHEGTSYCVGNFGTSDIIWNIDPLDAEAQVTVVDNALVFQGRCPQAQRI